MNPIVLTALYNKYVLQISAQKQPAEGGLAGPPREARTLLRLLLYRIDV